MRKILHVVPNKDTKEWFVKENDSVLTAKKTKMDAIRFAQEEIYSQIIIHGKDGKIQKEYTYGLDPKKTIG